METSRTSDRSHHANTTQFVLGAIQPPISQSRYLPMRLCKSSVKLRFTPRQKKLCFKELFSPASGFSGCNPYQYEQLAKVCRSFLLSDYQKNDGLAGSRRWCSVRSPPHLGSVKTSIVIISQSEYVLTAFDKGQGYARQTVYRQASVLNFHVKLRPTFLNKSKPLREPNAERKAHITQNLSNQYIALKVLVDFLEQRWPEQTEIKVCHFTQ